MNDDTLAPFVDALTSALIIMVLVSIFFLVQTATSITQSAKLVTITNNNIDEGTPLFTPITYRDVVEYSLDEDLFRYIVNFKLDSVHRDLIAAKLKDATYLMITIKSNDDKRKSAVNILKFIETMNISPGIEVHTEVLPSNSVLSSLSWKVIK